MSDPLLSISELHKSYAVPVLRGVDFTLLAGEVHALVGANGAGKTTLCNVIAGLTAADSGSMRIRGEPYCPASVRHSESAGVRMVMQELNLIDNLSIAENLYLTRLPKRANGLIDFPRLFDDARELLASIGLGAVDPRRKLGTLGVGQQQLVEIARILNQRCSLLMLDEPTAALTDPQIELLFEKVAQLKSQGTGVIYVSHRMNEIRRIADRITILRDGRTVNTSATGASTTEQIVHLMADDYDAGVVQQSDPVTRPVALRVRGFGTQSLLRDINLDIRYGEILGIAGLIGSGRTELLRTIFGADRADEGYLLLQDEDRRRLFDSPADAVKCGIGLIPEDRKRQGLLAGQSITSNISLSSLPRFRRALGWIDRDQERQWVNDYVRKLDIDCNDVSQSVSELSGGNQQKVCISRWLMKDCRVLLFDEPTRGIDIQTKSAIYELLSELASRGKAIVVVSSESRELTTLCDRIAVLSNGRLADVFERGEWSAKKIMAASFSAYIEARTAAN